MKILGIAGYSGSGKTTLIEKLVPLLLKEGLRVSLIKHAHHTFDVDQEGKDSYRHRHAGATEVLVTSSRRWVLMHELRGTQEPSFEEQLKHLSPCDLLIVEGFKHAPIPKTPIQVSPMRIQSFFGPRGWSVLKNEFLWIWLPGIVLVLLSRLPRPRMKS